MKKSYDDSLDQGSFLTTQYIGRNDEVVMERSIKNYGDIPQKTKTQ